MSLAQLFYLKETFRERMRQWRRSSFGTRHAEGGAHLTLRGEHARHAARVTRDASLFTLESLEPRLLLSVTVPQGELASLDVDLNGQADALTDGVVIIRHLFGFSGSALTEGAVDPAGQRTDPTAIANYLESIRPSLNVDLNQQADALTDGLVIMRSLFGFTGTSLTDGVIDPGGGRTDPAAIATFLDNMNPQRELIAPLVTAGLQQDSGVSATDGVTNTATITGTIADLNQIVSFTAGFDATPVANFTDIESHLLTTGTFTLTPATLAQIAGGTLADGMHTLHLRVTDANGNLTTLDRTFTLDTVAPVTPSVNLAVSSDTGVVGDQQTTAALVTLTGQTDATTTIQLVGTSQSTLTNGSGLFQLPNVALAVGANPVIIRASDLAGNQSERSQTLTRLTATQQADAVLTWHHTMLEAIRLDASAPPVASRGMAMVSLAIYDTLNAIDGPPGYYVSLPAQAGTDPNAAVAAAAHRMLSYLYPGQQATFDAQLAASLSAIPDGAGKTNALTLGRSIADAIIAIRSTDGWNDFVDHSFSTQPGQWQPTAPMYDLALLPQWADLTPFALTSPNQFSPTGPPALDSAAYTAAYNEVKALGSATNSTRTAEQTEIARFWSDGAGTATPPGHWNDIAQQIALQQGNSLSANARLFAQLNVALADAGITAWNTKYEHDFWRPITAIQQGAQDGNANTAADANWTSLLITPPFPEYVSGHSTYSGAAARILSSLFGTNVGFSTTSQGLPGVTRTFTSFDQAAQEAGRSRIYGGIHFEFSNQDGLTAGTQVADAVLNRFTVTTDTQGPTIILNQQNNQVTNTNLTLTGQVLDNLSGVASLQAKLDNGTLAPVTLSPTGTFTFTTTLLLDGTQDGAHTVTFQARDLQGNVTTRPVTFTLTTQAPTITLTSPADNATLTVDSRLTGTATLTGATLVALTYQFDSGTVMPVSFDPTTGSFDAALDLSTLSTGTHALTLRAQDQAGNVTTVTRTATLAASIPLTITSVTPANGSSDIGSTFRPQVFFSRPVNPATLNANNFYATDTTGTRLPATIVPSQDGTFAWLFFTNPMPGASTITLHVDGTTILGAADGQALDADGNGTAGGVFTSTFSTVSLVPLQGTTLSGRVLDPGPDLRMGTFDDIRAGADGILHTDDDVFLNPIAGATVYILGLESQAVVTDAQGNFSFTAVPSGTIKLAIDGRTATNAPTGIYFPEMVMDLQIDVGQANTVMGAMGTREERAANLTRPEVYLPRLQTSILQTVSNIDPTTITVDPEAAPNLTEQQRQYLTLEIQPGSLIDANGTPIANGQVGISTVPPELVRDMLPPGLLQHTFDITIQAPDAATFSTPLQMTFPNVFNAAPGTKLNFLSFDHTTGRLVIEGTATVSADGLSVTTDPGQGITKPGWHGVTPPGSVGTPSSPPPPGSMGEPSSASPPCTLLPPPPAGATPTRQVDVRPIVFGDSPANVLTLSFGPTGEGETKTVEIVVGSSAATFLDAVGTIPLTGGSFYIDASSPEQTFNLEGLSYHSMFGFFQGISALDDYKIFATKVTVKETTYRLIPSTDPNCQNELQYENSVETVHYIYRYFDANNGITPTTLEFRDVLADGAGRSADYKDLLIEQSGLVSSMRITGSTDFGLVLDTPQIKLLEFDPVAANVESNPTAELYIVTPEGNQTPNSIRLSGTATTPQHIYIDYTSFYQQVSMIAGLTTRDVVIDGSRIDATEESWLDTRQEQIDFLDRVARQVVDYFATGSVTLSQLPVGYTPSNSDIVVTFSPLARESDGSWTLGFAPDSEGWSGISDVVSKARGLWSWLTGGYSDEYLLQQLDTAINPSKTNTVSVYLNGFFEYFSNHVSTNIENSIAVVIAHEAGHAMGLVHTNGFAPTDVMAQGVDPFGTRAFTVTDEALRFATDVLNGITNQDIRAAATRALNYYEMAKNRGFLDSTSPDPFDDGGDITPIQGPALALTDTNDSLLTQGVDFGDLVVGASTSQTVRLRNIGTEVIHFNSVQASGSVAVALTSTGPLNPGESVDVILTLQPSVAGRLDAIGTVNTTELGPLNFSIRGQSLFAEAHINLEATANNVGAARLGEQAANIGTVAVSNLGMTELVFSLPRAIEGSSDFVFLGAETAVGPDGFYHLAAGATTMLRFAFTPSDTGLRRGIFAIESNDVSNPSARLSIVGTGFDVGLESEWGHDFVAVSQPQISDAPLRVVSSETGAFSVFLAENTPFMASYFDPASGLFGQTVGRTGASGTGTNLNAGLVLRASVDIDTDFDGLPDDIEYTIGTSERISDTDKDGLDDFAEIQQGLDPLDGQAVVTGVVAGLSLRGEAKGLVLEGSTLNSGAQTAYIATGSYGLAIVDASQFQRPVVLSQLDLPGDAVDVSVDSSLGIAAVASGTGGLHIVNVSTPTAPTLLRTIAVNASQVEVLEGIAYVGTGSEVRSYDLLTGERLATIVGGATITGLAREGQMLYTMDSGRVLRAIEIGANGMIARGTLTMPNDGAKLFVGNGIAYVGAEGSFAGGFQTANVSNPNALVLTSGVDAANLAGRALAVNGSGLAVSVGSPGGLGNLIQVLDVRDPANTGASTFITQYTLSADPFDVAIGAGIAFVADGTGGLQIVNYRAFDNQGVAPTVTATLDAVDLDPATPGIQLQEGSLVQLRPTVTDDVQVRNVELLVNGQVVRNDVAFPFELSTALPTIAANGSNQVTLQVRATDTGGNVGLSAPILVDLVPDTFAPTITSLTPIDGSRRGQAFRTVVVNFSEAMDASTLTAANIQLIGPNGAVTPANIQVRSDGRSVQLTYDPLLADDYQVVINQAEVKDRAGNAVGVGTTTSDFTIAQATNIFTNALGTGFWDQAGNWDGGVLPTETDDVLLDTPSGTEVIFRTGTATIRSLSSADPFRITGGTLAVTETIQVNNTFTLAGGTIRYATILEGTGGQDLGVTGVSTVDGVTLNGDVAVAGTSGALRVSGGLTLNGTIHLTGLNATVRAVGTQTFGGGGTIAFEGPAGFVPGLTIEGASTLTLGPTFTVTGAGVIGGQAEAAGTNALVNQGTIAVTGAGQTLTIRPTGTWTNPGTIQVTNGTLALGGTFTAAEVAPARVVRNATSTINFTGTLTNTGTTVTLEAGPTWQISGGQITGGTVAGAGTLGAAGFTVSRLDGVVLEANLLVAAGGRVIVSNGLTLHGIVTLTSVSPGTVTALDFEGAGTQTLGGTGRVVFGGTSSGNQVRPITTGGTLVVGPGIVVEGGTGSGTVGSGTLGLLVQGQVRTAGRTITLRGTSIINDGMLDASSQGGVLAVIGALSNSGTISLAPGALMNVTGSYTQTATGSLGINIGGTATTQFGRMTITGSATLNGTLNVLLVNGFTPALNDPFRFMTNGSRAGFFATTNGLDLGGGLAFQVEQTDPLDLELVTVAAAGGSSLVQSAEVPTNLSLAYVQQSWLKDFVAGDPPAVEEDEELQITLPG